MHSSKLILCLGFLTFSTFNYANQAIEKKSLEPYDCKAVTITFQTKKVLNDRGDLTYDNSFEYEPTMSEDERSEFIEDKIYLQGNINLALRCKQRGQNFALKTIVFPATVESYIFGLNVRAMGTKLSILPEISISQFSGKRFDEIFNSKYVGIKVGAVVGVTFAHLNPNYFLLMNPHNVIISDFERFFNFSASIGVNAGFHSLEFSASIHDIQKEDLDFLPKDLLK